MQLKIEHNWNIPLEKYLRSGGLFARPVLLHGVFPIQHKRFCRGPPTLIFRSGLPKGLLRSVMKLDLEKYRPDVQALGIPSDQQDEFIHILWNLTEGLADNEFGIARSFEAGPILPPVNCSEEHQQIDSDKEGLSAAFSTSTQDDTD